MKICNKCKIEKDFNKFRKYSSGKLSPICYTCSYQSLKTKVKPEIKERICYTCQKTKSVEYFHKHSGNSTGYANTCKECRKDQSKSFYGKNKDHIKKRTIQRYYNIKHTPEFISKRRQYQKNLNESAKLARRLRNRLYYALKNKNWKKNTHFVEYIGCDRDTLLNHIESQFQQGMSWNNMSEWHVDHIIPLSSAKSEEEMYTLCHYTNLQPLWAVENIKKYNKIQS